MSQKIDEFCALLEEQVTNHSIYVWGGNGETFPTLCESWIRRRERSTGRVDDALKTFNERVEKGYDAMRAFDCSGLGYWALKELGLQKSDLKADTLYKYCRTITKDQLCKGCFVFHISNGKATHIGYVVDDDLNVIEALGRAEGVVKRAFSKGKWEAFGSPKYFNYPTKTVAETAQIEAEEVVETEEEPEPEEIVEEELTEEEQAALDAKLELRSRICSYLAGQLEVSEDEVSNALWNL